MLVIDKCESGEQATLGFPAMWAAGGGAGKMLSGHVDSHLRLCAVLYVRILGCTIHLAEV